MNYEFILKEICPSQEEIDSARRTTEKVIAFLNKTCKEESIPAEAMAVGSVAKKTWLSGKSDIDIFIHFPLEYEMDELKEKGLYLGYKTNDALNGVASEHYASHPYLTCDIDGFEVDIVPCYRIEDGSQLKSAVDRTILHTNYIKSHLKEGQEKEVLLLKKFMDCVGTYGSEFKTGGFAGYLCELLILNYGTFEKTLREARNWTFHTIIDLENYGTSEIKLFKKDPLVVIDPTDMNRNVGAALRIERMLDFIQASRNLLRVIDDDNLSEEDRQIKVYEYFNPLVKVKFLKDFGNNGIIGLKSVKEISEDLTMEFKDRETKTMVIEFPIPEMSADALHPQLLKTVESIVDKIESEGFSVFEYNYWTDEDRIVIFTIELEVYRLGKYYVHEGPKVWNRVASENFAKKWGEEIYVDGEFNVLRRERPFKEVEGFIKYVLDEENVHLIKVGKNIKKVICDESRVYEIDEFLRGLDDVFSYVDDESQRTDLELDFLNSIDDLLNPGQYLIR